ncbi:AaceriAER277Wp [[Ashbya] aceris (nom. inval.)]|nr:AaceriAER277Wp [[Ashbya] aceris (nom. inval.)]
MVPLVDSHCHVRTRRSAADAPVLAPAAGTTRCVMSCNVYDWKTLAATSPGCIGFGVHPWYAHLFSLEAECNKATHYRAVLQARDTQELQALIAHLPPPISLEAHIAAGIAARPQCVGEVGLDKVFRLPAGGVYESGGALTGVRVSAEHQLAVFRRMCELAVAQGLPLSVHAVRWHGKVLDVCREVLGADPRVNVCLHSYSGDIHTGRRWCAAFGSRVFFGVSNALNLRDYDAALQLLRTLPLESLLTETDRAIDDTEPAVLESDLQAVLRAIRDAHGLPSVDAARMAVYSNFCRFLSM